MRAVVVGTNRAIIQPFSDAGGYARLEFETLAEVRVIVPYFGPVWDVPASGQGVFTLLLDPGNQVGLIPEPKRGHMNHHHHAAVRRGPGVVVVGIGVVCLLFITIVLWSGVCAVWNSVNRLFGALVRPRVGRCRRRARWRQARLPEPRQP